MDTLYTDPIFLNFGIYCLLVFSLYQFFDKAFKHYNTHYQKQKKDVQDYVISNITKSVILLIIAIYNYNIICEIKCLIVYIIIFYFKFVKLNTNCK